MKIEIDDRLAKETNEIFKKYYDWDGTIEEWESWVQELIEGVVEEFRYI